MTPSVVRDAALARVHAAFDQLSCAELEDLAAGRGRLVFRTEAAGRIRRPEQSPVDDDVQLAVEDINLLTRPADVADYLRRHQFTVPMLREIARALGPTVSAAGRSKERLIRDIVEGTAGYRVRSHAMSGGAWS